MKVIVSLFWGFIFAFIAIFIISSILGSNGISKGLSLQNCAILAIFFTIGASIITSMFKPSQNKEK